jgi:ATP-dependent protease ClpP protease subunit
MSSKKQHLFREGESVILVPGFDITTYIEEDEEGGGIFRLGREEENGIRMELLHNDVPKILIHEPITFRTADYVRKAITFIEVTHAKLLPNVEVEITTPGGSVEASFEIYNRFKGYSGGIIGVVQGYGYSGGGFILQGCHRRIVNEYSKLMVHKASTWIHVTEHLLSCPARLDILRRDLGEDNERVLKMCAERVHLCKPHEKIVDIERRISKLFVQEKFLYAERAKEEGLCDLVGKVILEGVAAEEPAAKKADEEEKGNGELSNALKNRFKKDKKEAE